jgi:hypothetical protein
MTTVRIKRVRKGSQSIHILSHLFSTVDSSFCEDDDSEFSINFDDFGDAIWIAAVVDVSCETA